jgi:hypothetical protein
LHGFRQGLQSFKAPIKNNNIKTLTAPGIDIHLVQQQQSSSKTSFIQLLKTQYQKLSFLNVLHDAEQNETLQINLVEINQRILLESLKHFDSSTIKHLRTSHFSKPNT